MEAQSRRRVDVGVGMVHAVEAPEQRHLVEGNVLRPHGEVEQHEACHDRQPARYGDGVEQSDPARVGEERGAHDAKRCDEAHEQRVECDDAKVRRPAAATQVQPIAARPDRLREQHCGQYANEGREPDDRLCIVHAAHPSVAARRRASDQSRDGLAAAPARMPPSMVNSAPVI